MRTLTKENMKFGAAGFMTFAMCSIFLTFSISFFNEAGYSETQIGFMFSVTVLISMLSQVVTGYLSDNVITIKKILLIDIALTMVVVLLMLLAKNIFPLLFVLFALYSMAGRMASQLVDGYIARVSQRRSGLDFGFARGISSMGWATAAIVGGMLIQKFGMWMMFAIHTVFCVVALVVVLFLEDVPLNKKIKAGNEQSKAKPDGFFVAAKAVFKTRGFVLVSMACLLMQTGIYTVLTYYQLIVKAVGGQEGHVGIAMFLLSMSEVPVLWNYFRLRKRFKDGHMMAFAMLMYVVRAILWISFQNVLGVILIQLMQSVTFGLFVPSAMRYMQRLVPERHMNTGIMIWMAIYSSGGQIVGSMLGGVLLEYYGIVPLYIASAVANALGAGLMLLAMHRGTAVERAEAADAA